MYSAQSYQETSKCQSKLLSFWVISIALCFSEAARGQIAVPEAPTPTSNDNVCDSLNIVAKAYCEEFIDREETFVKNNLNNPSRFPIYHSNYLRGYLDLYDATKEEYFLERFITVARPMVVIQARLPDNAGYIGYGWDKKVGKSNDTNRWVFHMR